MKIFLVDGSALLYRSHFAFQRQPLTTSQGEITSATFGFVNALLRLMEEEEADALAVAFDPPGPTFRHEVYPEYKAQRPPMPGDLRAQVARVREAVESLGISIFEQQGFEADDVLATLAARGAEAGHDMWIYSADKDFVPLVRPRVGILRPAGRGGEETYLDERGIVQKYGVRPTQFLDVLTLMGDTSDNVPGVPGIGQKTAIKLVRQFESLDRLLENLEDKKLTPRHRKLLSDHREQIQTSRELLKTNDHVPVAEDIDWNDLEVQRPYPAAFRDLCRELEFHRLLQRIEADDGAPSAVRAEARLVTTLEDLDALVRELRSRGRFALRVITDAPDPHRGELVALAFAWDDGAPRVVPVDVGGGASIPGGLFDGPAATKLSWADVSERVRPLLNDISMAKIGHDVKADQIRMGRCGLDTRGFACDVELAGYLLAPERRGHDLTSMMNDILGWSSTSAKELLEGGGWADVALDRLAAFAGEQVEAVARLWEVFEDQLEAEELSSVFYDLEMPLSSVLLAMEKRGIRLDQKLLASFAGELREKIAKLTVSIYEGAGEEFNLNSPQQLSRILFEKIGLKPGKKTASGYSTDVAVLTKLADDHPLPGQLLEYRQLQKLSSTYVEALPKLVHDDGCLHTRYQQAVAATGRLSSTDPNLQNIPIRTEMGRRIREAFVAREKGWVLLAADYSQIELRLMAHMSSDLAMCESFQRGEDIHARTAALVNDVQLEGVDADMRRRAKAINFGLLYGMGARALAQQIGVKTAEAQSFIDQYFERFPKVRGFIRDTIDEATAQREVRTLLGRRRRLPELASSDPRQRAFGERIAVNTPIQGSAADLIKLAMIRLDHRIAADDLPAHMLLQVHDELVFEVEESQVEAVASVVQEVMENVFDLKVPLVVDVAHGRSWAEAHA